MDDSTLDRAEHLADIAAIVPPLPPEPAPKEPKPEPVKPPKPQRIHKGKTWEQLGLPAIPLNESKADIYGRLRIESRWAEASAWRKAREDELRALGMTRSDANARAWLELQTEYPPPSGPGINLSVRSPETYSDFARDIIWVATHLDDIPRPCIHDAPTRSAMVLFRWADENRDKFFTSLYRGVMEDMRKDKQASGNNKAGGSSAAEPESKPDMERTLRMIEELSAEAS